jgi:succinate-semialdehyde dehydrogenase/glutarate-semialdehyde dehydrogenase
MVDAPAGENPAPALPDFDTRPAGAGPTVAAMSYPTLALHVGGRWISAASGGERVVSDPATGAALAALPLAGAAELAAAAEASVTGFRAWRAKTALERCQVLRRAAELMRRRADEIAAVLTLEQGKPLAESRREVGLAADVFDFQAEEGRRLYGRTVPPRVDGVLSHTVLRRPVGPVAAFTPWNFPAQLPARKLASALAAGCSVVLKPAEETPGTALRMVQCLLEAGVVPDALSLVWGVPAEVSAFLIDHPAIEKVSFTGSVPVGQLLGERAARHVKRFTGELGGHAPVIVAPDADPDFVLKLAVPAKFRNAGQVCASPIRFYLPRALFERFAADFAAAARALRLGPGLEASTQMGPLTHERRVEDMERFVDDALAQGARLLCGGRRAPGAGCFFEPTVFADVPAGTRLLRDEPFGPIAVLQPYDTLDEAIAAANATRYALGAYAFTRDLHTAHRLAEELEAGMVGINHFGVSQPELPFGGWKCSGIGQEMGAEGLLHYTEVKTVTVGVPS